MDEDKLEAWIKWCISAHLFEDVTSRSKIRYAESLLENSSHGKAFSYAWDKCSEIMNERG